MSLSKKNLIHEYAVLHNVFMHTTLKYYLTGRSFFVLYNVYTNYLRSSKLFDTYTRTLKYLIPWHFLIDLILDYQNKLDFNETIKTIKPETGGKKICNYIFKFCY